MAQPGIVSSEALEDLLAALAARAHFTVSFDTAPKPARSRQVPQDHAAPERELFVELANMAAERAVRLYAETHPRPTQVNQQQAAEMLGVTSKTVQRYVRFGSLKLNRCGRIPIEAVDEIRSAK